MMRVILDTYIYRLVAVDVDRADIKRGLSVSNIVVYGGSIFKTGMFRRYVS